MIQYSNFQILPSEDNNVTYGLLKAKAEIFEVVQSYLPWLKVTMNDCNIDVTSLQKLRASPQTTLKSFE